MDTRLMDILKGYTEQFIEHDINGEDPIDDNLLAKKEFLDLGVLKKLYKDENWIYSNEFKNYIEYIKALSKKRDENGNGQHLDMEYMTNIVFREFSSKIFSIYFKYEKDKINDNINKNKRQLQELKEKIINRGILSQDELNFIGEYIYTSRDTGNEIAKYYTEYLFCEKKKLKLANIKPSSQILGGIAVFIQSQYRPDGNEAGVRIDI